MMMMPFRMTIQINQGYGLFQFAAVTECSHDDDDDDDDDDYWPSW